MDSLSHDPAAGDIGSQLVDIGTQGLSTGATAAVSVLAGLIPAGGEEVSAQAVMAFAQEAATMLASNAAAQEELVRTGTTLTDIARMYGDTDAGAAGALTVGGAAIGNQSSAGGSAVRAGAGLSPAGALTGEAGLGARAPLVSQLASAPSSPIGQAAASAGSSAMSGAAPAGSGMAPGAGAPVGGSSKAGLASASGPADEDDNERQGVDDQPTGERLA